MRYVVLYAPGRNHADATEAWAGHVALMQQFYQAGKVLMGGPFPKGSRYSGLAIIEADSMDEVHAIVAQDPPIVGGYAIPEIFPWPLLFDRLADGPQ